jgi:hypothetical protein
MLDLVTVMLIAAIGQDGQIDHESQVLLLFLEENT